MKTETTFEAKLNPECFNELNEYLIEIGIKISSNVIKIIINDMESIKRD